MGLKVSEMHESAYLSRKDAVNPLRLTMETAYMEEMPDGKTEPVLSWSDHGVKPMVLNVTNRMFLRDLYGDDSDDWRGKPIEVYVDPNVMHKGQRVGGLRLRAITGAIESPPADTNPLTKDEAFALAAEHDIDQVALVNRLKGAGLTSWAQNPGQATLIVKAMVSEMGNVQPDDDIPF